MTPTQNPDRTGDPRQMWDATPISRVRFADTNGNYVECDSLRQAAARFHSLRYVHSSNKYTVTDATINQFWTVDSNGNRTGKPNFGNCAIYAKRMMPDLQEYVTRHIKRDWNTMTTESDLMRLDNQIYAGGFDDTNELPGTQYGEPPNGGGGGGPTN